MSEKISVVINDIKTEVEKGTIILDAAKEIGIEIPTLCYLVGVSDVGMCRLCMVEIEGYNSLLPACRTKCLEGMVITTESERLTEYRRDILNLLLANHKLQCMNCPANGTCRLQQLSNQYKADKNVYQGSRVLTGDPAKRIADDNPYIAFDSDKCIQCQRCVNVCQNISCNGVLAGERCGNKTMVLPAFGKDYKTNGCESCGNCTSVCPTGALYLKRKKEYRSWEATRVQTTCPHCATGCQFNLILRGDKIVDIETVDGPANHRRLCVKGRSGSFDFIYSKDRLTKPLIKDRATGEFREATWYEAISYTAKRFMEIKEQYGGEALAGFACSRSANEDIYMVNNTDNCARVCHSATVAGLAKTLGSGAMTNPIADITKNVDCIFLIGSNPEEAHPVVGMRIRKAVQNGTRLIVVDPRDIGLTKSADIHIKLRPGTNVAFINGLMHVIIKEDLVDHDYINEFTEGFEELKKLVEEYPPEKVAKICHIDPDQLIEAARMYATAEKAPIIYCLGVTEHSSGTEGVMSLSNMAAICGKIGKSGCGVNPLRGQNNVQGACDMGAIPTDYPGYQKVDNPEVQKKFEDAWGVKLSAKPGLKATDVFPAAIEGKIKGLYICGEDPIVSDPDTHHIEKALESLDFFVVQDLFMTKTAKYADVILPGISYAEKEGTFTNTERRVQRIRKAVTLRGDMRPDTEIITDLMNAMGYPQKFMTPAQIMDEIASVTPSFGGISHERLDRDGGIQWPCPDKNHPGTPIMHVGKPVRGKVLLYPAAFNEARELPDEEYPFILSTGRILYHYNAAAMTARSKGLVDLAGEGFIEINYKDAEKLGIENGERILVGSRRGEITATAHVGRKVSEGETWMPFHYEDSPVNMLTNAELDDIARIPEYKVCAVRIKKQEPAKEE